MTLAPAPAFLPRLANSASSSAAEAAVLNFQANTRALAQTQPVVAAALPARPALNDWAYARDGALTVLDAAGQWWSGCSLPRRASHAMLRSLSARGAASCFLAPTHACQIETALAILPAGHSIFVILPAWDDLRVAMHCTDFSRDIAAHRLWFAAGPDWLTHLRDLFAVHPGLPLPQQFIRTPLVDEAAAGLLMQPIQRLIGDESRRRLAILEECRTPADADRAGEAICLIAPSRFRLWDDAARALLAVARQAGMPCAVLDTDDPVHGTLAAIALAARSCQAVIAANLTRSAIGAALSPQIPLISWLTRPEVPPFATAGPSDALLVADARWVELAHKAGWPAHRIALADWPDRQPPPALPLPAAAPPKPPHLALIADTLDTKAIADGFDLSSHRLLWEWVYEELRSNPFLLDPDIELYLLQRMRRIGIAEDGFDLTGFAARIVLPAYQQGIAAHLLKQGLPLRIYGHAWKSLPDFADHAAGPIESDQQLLLAAASASALVHAWPTDASHPVLSLHRPVLRPWSLGPTVLIHEARRALAGAIPPCARPTPKLAADLLRDFIAPRRMPGGSAAGRGHIPQSARPAAGG